MGRAQYKLQRDVKKEQSKISKASAKRGLWSKIGMGLGGLIAIGLTGGAATPLVAALMAGGGTLAGGFAGRQIAAKSKGGKIRGGKFFQDERESLISNIDQSIWAGAGKSFLTAGMTALGAGVSFGKAGLKAAIPGKSISVGASGVKTAGEGFKMGDIIKRGAETATYSDSLLGKLGKAIDIKGSVGYKLGGFLKKGVTNLGGNISTGFENKTMDWSTLPEGMSPRDYQALVGERQASYAASQTSQKADALRTALGKAPSFDEMMSGPIEGSGFKKGILPGHSKVQYDVLKGHQFGPLDGAPQPTSTKPLSSSLNWRDAGVKQTDQYGSFTGGTQHSGTGSGQSVAQELGEQSLFSRRLDADNIASSDIRLPEDSGFDYLNPSKMDVPFTGSKVSASQAQESSILQNELKDYQLSDFAEGMRSDPGRLRVPTSGSGTDFTQTAAWERAGVSFGVTSPDLLGNIGEPFSQSPSYGFMDPLGQKRKDMAFSLKWHNKLFGE